ncbi:MAG: hypothetical protein WCP79_04865 [Bacillota bacterium]
MKKVLAGIILGLMLSSAVYAAPLTDYSWGSAQVDFGLGYNCGGANDPWNSPSLSFGNGIAANAGMTVGLGSQLAFRARVNFADNLTNTNTSENNVVYATVNPTLELLWQCIPYERSPVALAVFGGCQFPFVFDSGGRWPLGNHSAYGIWAGAQAMFQPMDRVTVFTGAAMGNKSAELMLGAGYSIDKSFDVNIGVNAINYFPVHKDSSPALATLNITSITPYCSLSYRFML